MASYVASIALSTISTKTHLSIATNSPVPESVETDTDEPTPGEKNKYCNTYVLGIISYTNDKRF